MHVHAHVHAYVLLTYRSRAGNGTERFKRQRHGSAMGVIGAMGPAQGEGKGRGREGQARILVTRKCNLVGSAVATVK